MGDVVVTMSTTQYVYYKGWLVSCVLYYEIFNTSRGAVYHCKGRQLVNIFNVHMLCADWCILEKLLENWTSCVCSGNMYV